MNKDVISIILPLVTIVVSIYMIDQGNKGYYEIFANLGFGGNNYLIIWGFCILISLLYLTKQLINLIRKG